MVDLDRYAWEWWWENTEAGTTVHRLTFDGEPTLFVKEGPGVSGEHDRMQWCQGRLPVPEIVAFSPGDVARLVTRGLPGNPAHDRAVVPDSASAALVLAEAWRTVHALDPVGCPFDTTTDTLLAVVEAGLDDPYEVWDFEREVMRAATDVYAELVRDRPPAFGTVVVHGDASATNALVHDGRLSGIIDIGDLGVGDPWWDLAACLSSMSRPDNALGHERDRFLAAYGAEPDPERERWFRLLYRLRWDAR